MGFQIEERIHKCLHSPHDREMHSPSSSSGHRPSVDAWSEFVSKYFKRGAEASARL